MTEGRRLREVEGLEDGRVPGSGLGRLQHRSGGPIKSPGLSSPTPEPTSLPGRQRLPPALVHLWRLTQVSNVSGDIPNIPGTEDEVASSDGCSPRFLATSRTSEFECNGPSDLTDSEVGLSSGDCAALRPSALPRSRRANAYPHDWLGNHHRPPLPISNQTPRRPPGTVRLSNSGHRPLRQLLGILGRTCQCSIVPTISSLQIVRSGSTISFPRSSASRGRQGKCQQAPAASRLPLGFLDLNHKSSPGRRVVVEKCFDRLPRCPES